MGAREALQDGGMIAPYSPPIAPLWDALGCFREAEANADAECRSFYKGNNMVISKCIRAQSASKREREASHVSFENGESHAF